jgi:ankyrin repeat protein
MPKKISMKKELDSVLEKYRSHPQFLGIDLIDPNQRGAVDDTPLHLAANRGAVDDIEVLVANGADIHLTGDLGYTPLHCAALAGKLKAVEKLLSLGANPNARSEFSETPLDLASSVGNQDIVNFLTRKRSKRPK